MPRILFGPFEFDSATLELRREGVSVRLQPQPAQVLRALIENPDQVVSREQLRQSVWGNSTFVDFESGLNFCISQLRSALRDDAAQPLYIRTVPRRGYQFIAPMRAFDPQQLHTEFTEPAATAQPGGRERAVIPVAIPFTRPWSIAVLLVLVAALGSLAMVFHKRAVGRPPIVGVARFDNETGNPAFSSFANNLTDELVGQLANRGDTLYRVIGNAHVLFLPREQRDLRNIASVLNASYIVLGQVQASGDRIRVLAHLIRASDQTHIWVVRVERPARDMPQLDAEVAGQIAAAFASRLAANPDRAPSFQTGSH